MRHSVGLEWRSTFHIISAPLWVHSIVHRVVLVHVSGGGFMASHTQRIPLSLPPTPHFLPIASTARRILCMQFFISKVNNCI